MFRGRRQHIARHKRQTRDAGRPGGKSCASTGGTAAASGPMLSAGLSAARRQGPNLRHNLRGKNDPPAVDRQSGGMQGFGSPGIARMECIIRAGGSKELAARQQAASGADEPAVRSFSEISGQKRIEPADSRRGNTQPAHVAAGQRYPDRALSRALDKDNAGGGKQRHHSHARAGVFSFVKTPVAPSEYQILCPWKPVAQGRQRRPERCCRQDQSGVPTVIHDRDRNEQLSASRTRRRSRAGPCRQGIGRAAGGGCEQAGCHHAGRDPCGRETRHDSATTADRGALPRSRNHDRFPGRPGRAASRSRARHCPRRWPGATPRDLHPWVVTGPVFAPAWPEPAGFQVQPVPGARPVPDCCRRRTGRQQCRPAWFSRSRRPMADCGAAAQPGSDFMLRTTQGIRVCPRS